MPALLEQRQEEEEQTSDSVLERLWNRYKPPEISQTVLFGPTVHDPPRKTHKRPQKRNLHLRRAGARPLEHYFASNEHNSDIESLSNDSKDDDIPTKAQKRPKFKPIYSPTRALNHPSHLELEPNDEDVQMASNFIDDAFVPESEWEEIPDKAFAPPPGGRKVSLKDDNDSGKLQTIEFLRRKL